MCIVGKSFYRELKQSYLRTGMVFAPATNIAVFSKRPIFILDTLTE